MTGSKADAFRALHSDSRAFVIANAWDGASARVLTAQGFRALATSSGAAAATLGRGDGRITRDESLEGARVIVQNTSLPVSADLEKGFGDDPATVADTIRRAAAIGLAGGSIEDFTGDPANPLFDEGLAVERIVAAVEAARSIPGGFVLTARCENFLRGRTELAATVRRLQAYERAGADVLFAPGLPDLAAVRTVCREVGRPVNFMAGLPGKSFTVPELIDAGVKRISLAGSLYRAAMTSLVAAAREVLEQGTFTYIDSSIPSREFNTLLG